MFNIFREKRVLRWTAKEIIQKFKKLPGGEILTLRDALHEKAHVKIDEIILLEGRFIEITNFVFLGYIDEAGVPQNINIPILEDETVIEGLKEEIEKLYFSDFYYSPFKAAKRMFALARFIYLTSEGNNFSKELQKIIPFVSSDISYLYQIKSELEAVAKVFEVSRSLPKKAIDDQLDNIKMNFSNIIELEDRDLQYLNRELNDIMSTGPKKNKYKKIKHLANTLKNVISYYTILYLGDKKLSPPPKKFLPKKMKYKIKRRDPKEIPQRNSELIKLYKQL